jgi:hypothetical protein
MRTAPPPAETDGLRSTDPAETSSRKQFGPEAKILPRLRAIELGTKID